eukprot:Rhum_TRINITY_DN6584_c0_g1::Rhum_TRINITY_DN6584_c0_g1_i1::g.20471::m.20471
MTDAAAEICCDAERVEAFSADGFTVLAEPVVSDPALYISRIEAVLAGEYDLETPPLKVPKRGQILAARGLVREKRPQTLHIINIHQSDAAFRRLALSENIGRMVCALMRWPSARLAEDQVWVKPPGAGPLTYHRDTTYFDFVPKQVCTVWLTFDELYDQAVGPLEYCAGSHRWGTSSRRGSANKFFDADYRGMMLQCARDETGSDEVRLHVVQAPAGGGSVHDGSTWHGSSANTTEDTWRRGIGFHYIHGEATFQEGPIGRLWAPHRTEGSLTLPDERFPVVARV